MAKLTFKQYDELKKEGLDDTQIQALADKYGYSMPKEGILASAAETLLVKPAARVAEAVGRTGFLGDTVKRGYEEMSRNGEAQNFNTPFGAVNVEAQKSFGNGGATQITADALDSASYLAPIKGATWVGKSISGAASGYAADVASGLRDGEGAGSLVPGLGTVAGAIAPNLGSLAAGAKSYFNKTTRFATAQVSGLNPETITTALTRPNELTKAQREGLSRTSVAEKVQTAFKQRLSDLSTTGKKYQPLREGSQKVDIPENFVRETLRKFNIDVDASGKLVRTTESIPLTKGDIDEIEKFIIEYGNERQLSANGFLNAREALSRFGSRVFGSDKSKSSQKVAAELRARFDELGKGSIKGLKELDTEFSPQIKDIGRLRKYLFDKDGNLTDVAINKIANAAGKGKDQLLSRLEDLQPGITQQLQLVKALEDISDAQGQKVGTYLRAGAGIGAGTVTGNVPLIVASFLAANPVTAIPIIKTFGRMKGFSDDVIEKVSGKLMDGSPLNASELMLVRKAIVNHIANLPSDKFDDEVGNDKPVTETQNGTITGEVPTNN